MFCVCCLIPIPAPSHPRRSGVETLKSTLRRMLSRLLAPLLSGSKQLPAGVIFPATGAVHIPTSPPDLQHRPAVATDRTGARVAVVVAAPRANQAAHISPPNQSSTTTSTPATTTNPPQKSGHPAISFSIFLFVCCPSNFTSGRYSGRKMSATLILQPTSTTSKPRKRALQEQPKTILQMREPGGRKPPAKVFCEKGLQGSRAPVFWRRNQRPTTGKNQKPKTHHENKPSWQQSNRGSAGWRGRRPLLLQHPGCRIRAGSRGSVRRNQALADNLAPCHASGSPVGLLPLQCEREGVRRAHRRLTSTASTRRRSPRRLFAARIHT